MKTYHGVSCAWCREPILIPAKVVSLWNQPEHRATSFAARCKSCVCESVYSIREVQTFEGEPPTRIPRDRTRGKFSG